MSIIPIVGGNQFSSFTPSVMNDQMPATPSPQKDWTTEEIDADIVEKLKSTKQLTLSPESQGFLSVTGESGTVHSIAENRIHIIESMIVREDLEYELSPTFVERDRTISVEYTFRLISNEANGFIRQDPTLGDLFGQSISAAGDLNGDGYDDLVIGQGVGPMYILFGVNNQKV